MPPNSNVWVDVGTVWREVLAIPTTAAHTIGKLLKRVGEHRVLWGTDAVWYGSPQAQISRRSARSRSRNEFQERFGYPALTDAVKAKVLGLNAAKLFDLDADGDPLRARSDPLTGAQPTAAHLRDEGVLPPRFATERADDPARDARSGSRNRQPGGRLHRNDRYGSPGRRETSPRPFARP